MYMKRLHGEMEFHFQKYYFNQILNVSYILYIQYRLSIRIIIIAIPTVKYVFLTKNYPITLNNLGIKQ